MTQNHLIRPATIADVPDIHRLVNTFARRNLMLPRVINDIYERVYEFIVLRTGCGRSARLVGCVALHPTWTGRPGDVMGEVRSLAVDRSVQGRGYGRTLVSKVHETARALGISKLFALTYVPDFFVKLGYRIVPRESLPHKVWTECINCPFFMTCKETPVVRDLE